MDTSNGPQNVYPMPERSTSTAIDERSAVLVGSTERRVHFNLVQTLGMIFSITAPPIGIGLYLSLIVGVGGFRFYIWGYLFSAFFQLITCLAVAELASAIPHSSGKLRLLRACDTCRINNQGLKALHFGCSNSLL